MKINITNVPAITAALGHTARYSDIVHAAQDAESQLFSLGFTLQQRKGATVSCRYGSTVAKLVRGSKSWFVVELGTSNTMVGTFVTLSPQQDQIAVARFRTFYGVSSV